MNARLKGKIELPVKGAAHITSPLFPKAAGGKRQVELLLPVKRAVDHVVRHKSLVNAWLKAE
jgi:hypothetical protein